MLVAGNQTGTITRSCGTCGCVDLLPGAREGPAPPTIVRPHDVSFSSGRVAKSPFFTVSPLDWAAQPRTTTFGWMDRDVLIRHVAVDHCRALARTWGDAVPANELTKGFECQGQKVLLVAWGRGIFKPEQLQDGPLTLVSSLRGNCADEALDGDLMLYDYAPPSFAWANEGLKRLSQQGRAVILLKQVKPQAAPRVHDLCTGRGSGLRRHRAQVPPRSVSISSRRPSHRTRTAHLCTTVCGDRVQGSPPSGLLPS